MSAAWESLTEAERIAIRKCARLWNTSVGKVVLADQLVDAWRGPGLLDREVDDALALVLEAEARHLRAQHGTVADRELAVDAYNVRAVEFAALVVRRFEGDLGREGVVMVASDPGQARLLGGPKKDLVGGPKKDLVGANFGIPFPGRRGGWKDLFLSGAARDVAMMYYAQCDAEATLRMHEDLSRLLGGARYERPAEVLASAFFLVRLGALDVWADRDRNKFYEVRDGRVVCETIMSGVLETPYGDHQEFIRTAWLARDQAELRERAMQGPLAAMVDALGLNKSAEQLEATASTLSNALVAHHVGASSASVGAKKKGRAKPKAAYVDAETIAGASAAVAAADVAVKKPIAITPRELSENFPKLPLEVVEAFDRGYAITLPDGRRAVRAECRQPDSSGSYDRLAGLGSDEDRSRGRIDSVSGCAGRGTDMNAVFLGRGSSAGMSYDAWLTRDQGVDFLFYENSAPLAWTFRHVPREQMEGSSRFSEIAEAYYNSFGTWDVVEGDRAVRIDIDGRYEAERVASVLRKTRPEVTFTARKRR